MSSRNVRKASIPPRRRRSHLSPHERSLCWSAQKNQSRARRLQSGALQQQLQGVGITGRRRRGSASCTRRPGAEVQCRRDCCLPRRDKEAQTSRTSSGTIQGALQVPAVRQSEGSAALARSCAPSPFRFVFFNQNFGLRFSLKSGAGLGHGAGVCSHHPFPARLIFLVPDMRLLLFTHRSGVTDCENVFLCAKH